jgi:hypothetical protein
MTQGLQNGSQRYIKHYGVKGMRWGVRKSGAGSSTTPKEKARPEPSADYVKKVELRREIKKDRGKTRTLSNEEMQAVIKRMELEQKYDNLNVKQAEINRSKSKINRALKRGGMVVATVVSAQQLYSNVKNNPITKKVAQNFEYSMDDWKKDVTG